MRCALVVGCLVALAAPGAGRAADAKFDDCDAAVSEHGDSYASAYCFYRVAAANNRWIQAGERLERYRRQQPDAHWMTLFQGLVELARGGAGTEALFRAAAEGFAEQGNARGEVLARINLRTLLSRAGRIDEAGDELDRAGTVADASGDPELRVRVLTNRAAHARETGRGLGQAYRTLERAEEVNSPGQSYGVTRSLLLSLGNVCFEMGRVEEALVHFRRLESLAAREGDRPLVATARYSIANTLLEQLLELPHMGGGEEVLRAAESALAAAQEAGIPAIEVLARGMIGHLLSRSGPDRTTAWEHLERCGEIAEELGEPQTLSVCLWHQGVLLSRTDPEEARRRIDRAVQLAMDAGDLPRLLYAWRYRMKLSWETASRDQAIEDSLRTLDVVETLRALQGGGEGRAGVLSKWTADYYRFSGNVLASGGEVHDEDLALSFAVMERMRARVLLDKLERADEQPGLPGSHPLVREREGVLAEIAAIHRRLLEPSLEDAARGALLSELARLELEERDLREHLSEATLGGPRYRTVEFAPLEAMRESLGEDEALLSYQVGLEEDLYGDFAGGAWLLASTRSGTRAYQVPDRVELERAVPTFVGLFERRDGSETIPSVALYRWLLEDALADLPDGVKRLVIVPDGRLHQLPFGALRKEAGSEPVGARYEIAVVPSATLLLRWRRAGPIDLGSTALALADPKLLRMGDEASRVREWVLASGEALGALPHAREEARAVARRFGGESRALYGDDASEYVVKSATSDRFQVIHLAAHAVIDEDFPERSAVLLAPGAEEEDGLLQAREIAELDLAGRVVVLSACRSASGAVLRGEGVMGLARAFFEAGAHAVVGSLWPLRDDDAARLFADFYRHLSSGHSLSGALRRARADAIAEGRPAAAWAGVVLLGEGTLVPIPGGSDPGHGKTVLLGALLTGAIVVLGVVWARRLRGGGRS